MKRKQSLKKLTFISICAFIFLSIPIFSSPALAVDDSVCARVKLEIRQELTLERQAFDAHMRIGNGFSHITLEDVDVDVKFTDEAGNPILASTDPNNTDALFFYRIDSMDNIADVDGNGTVAPVTTADIHWLIIPAPGASNGVPQGTLYYVGATLTYTIGGEEHVTEVNPDYIFVKPMPELTLDYFLPTDVYGDDAFTQETEPPIPFSLGVRVANNGTGIARNLKIDSAQPKIIDNEQGLLVGFVIEGSEIDGQAATKSLLVTFGDIQPNTASVARWIMTCTLSGEFVEFTADWSHSDELGGELTSLLEAVNTHFLVHDVLVDVTGRDAVRDFLAKDGGVYRVYESENTETVVTDQSGSADLSGAGSIYTLTTPVTAGFMYAQVTDPHAGEREITEVIRSDGKRIKLANCWLSKTRVGSQPWEYFLNIFDANTTGSYTISFAEPAVPNRTPVLGLIPNQTILIENELSFAVQATDEDGTTPALSAAPLPTMANFVDQGDGTGVFTWTPTAGQTGTYGLTFTASDGALTDTQYMTIQVTSIKDEDKDGMDDDWEMEHFGNLDRDGTGDFDNDGISDLDEYLNGTDPTSSNAPTVPVISAPPDTTEVTVVQPDLVIENSTDPDGDTITYTFEIYSDQEMVALVAAQTDVAEGTSGTTTWGVPIGLSDNTWYYWRVRATDGIGYSLWAYGSFFVNTENDPPSAFNISMPVHASEVDTQTPLLGVTNSVDVDEDVLTYTFEVFTDEGMTDRVAYATGIPQGAEGSTSWGVTETLDDNTWHFWRAVVTDEHGAQTSTTLVSFFVNTANDAPGAPQIVAPEQASEVENQDLSLVIENAVDMDEDPLAYLFELDTVNTFDSPAKQSSGAIAEGDDNTSWGVTGLDDNTEYFWRARADDGLAQSPWVVGGFFVNTANDNPSTPTLKNPGHGAWVTALTPALEVHASIDVDRDELSYRFEVYADPGLSTLLHTGVSETPAWVVPQELADNYWYYWQARAEDEHGAPSGWMDAAAFFTDSNGVNDPPAITVIEPGADIIQRDPSFTIQWADADPDSNAAIALYYDVDATGADGTLIVDGLTEDPDEVQDSYTWDLSALADGTYYIYAVIADEASVVATYAPGALLVNLVNEPPVLDPIGNKTVNEGEQLQFSVTATDPDPGDSLTLAAANLPAGASFDPAIGTFSWTPGYDQAGNYENIEFSVMDNGDPLEMDVELITITVGNVNRPPEFAPVGPQEVSEGELLEFTVAATDPDNDAIVYSTGDLPEGAVFDPNTRIFSWQPDHTMEGVYTVVFYATDDGIPNLIGQLEVLITVGDVPTPSELADLLVATVLGLDLPKHVENSYMANLKKVKPFIEQGKITPAINQLRAFVRKVEHDIAHGDIDPDDGLMLIDMANELIALLQGEYGCYPPHHRHKRFLHLWNLWKKWYKHPMWKKKHWYWKKPKNNKGWYR
jgi:hypothetical protein